MQSKNCHPKYFILLLVINRRVIKWFGRLRKVSIAYVTHLFELITINGLYINYKPDKLMWKNIIHSLISPN